MEGFCGGEEKGDGYVFRWCWKVGFWLGMGVVDGGWLRNVTGWDLCFE